VAEELSFRKAAKRLHITEPPLSRQIKALEEELGVRLLNRNRCLQVSLTDAGHSFLTDARQILALAAHSRERAQEAAGGSRGRLNIANIASLSSKVLPVLLQAFRKKYPQVEISLLEMSREEQIESLREQRIHLGIFPDLGAPLDTKFDSKILYSCPMVAVLSAAHDAEAKREGGLHIRELAGKTVLIPASEDAPGYLERFNQLCKVANFKPTAVRPVGGLENIMGMISAGYGVSIFPEVAVNPVDSSCRMRPLRSPVPQPLAIP
jgi:DNA-binding transcriptional LysR family regulator